MAAPEPKWSHRRVRENDVAQDIRYALTQTTCAYQQALNAEFVPYGVTTVRIELANANRRFLPRPTSPKTIR